MELYSKASSVKLHSSPFPFADQPAGLPEPADGRGQLHQPVPPRAAPAEPAPQVTHLRIRHLRVQGTLHLYKLIYVFLPVKICAEDGGCVILPLTSRAGSRKQPLA